MVNNTKINLWERSANGNGAMANLTGLGFKQTAEFTADKKEDFSAYMDALKSAGKRPALDFALVLLEEERKITGTRNTVKVQVMRVFEK